MTDANTDPNPLDRLAEEFVARLRRGEKPTAGEYAARHPELAADIRETFPVLVAMERAKPVADPHRPAVPGYRVLGLIGRGGMGEVYEAVQEALGRRVALKILRPRGRLTDGLRERFRREAQAAGRLHHTHIVPVFDSGEADGLLYFAMQLIPGRGLDEVFAEVRALRGDPARTTTTVAAASTFTGTGREYHRGVARLLADAADALAHAHRRGVLHRDVKPSNLLLDDAGAVWVTDFGLAKADDAGDLTATGDVVGTVRYMAPERFDGRADARSDVYALGLTAYEFAARRPAYDGPADPALVRRILAGPPAPPRTVDPTVPRDLETVILKATAANPAHRYPTADELAADLRRFADGLPVTARRVSAVEAAWRAARRNPLVASLAAAAVLVSVVGAAVSGWNAWRAGQNADRAEERAEGERLAKVEAEVRRTEAETARADAVRAAAAEKTANEQAQARLKQIEKGNAVLLSVFDDIDIRAVRATVDPLEAVLAKRLVRAAELLDGDAVGDPLVVANLQNQLGQTLLNLGYPNEAVPLFRKARDTWTAILGTDHRNTLAAMNNLAFGYQEAGRLDLALPLHQETFELMTARLGAADPLTLTAMNNLALGYQRGGKLDRAVPLFGAAVKRRKDAQGADHPLTLTATHNLADAQRAAGRFDLAVSLGEETLARRRVVLGAGHPDTLSSMNNLAAAYRAAGKLELAVPLFEQALAIMQSKLGADHPLTLTGMGSLAGAYRVAGKPDLAVPLFERALTLKTAKLGADHPETLAAMGNLAAAYWSAKRLDRSIPLLEEGLKLQRAKQGRDHPDALWAAVNLGVNYLDAGRVAEAVPLLEEAFRASGRHPSLRWAGPELLDAYARADKPEEATTLAAELLTDARSQSPKGSPQLANALARYSLALLQVRAYTTAEPALRECLTIREKTRPEAWTTFITRSMLGGALLGQRKYADAEPLLLDGYNGMKERAKDIPPAGRNRMLDAADRLVELYAATNRPDELTRWQVERATLRETLPLPRIAAPAR